MSHERTGVGDLDWFRARLVAQRAGLLDEDAAQRFRALLESSAECRDLYQSYGEEAPEDLEGHVPAAVLARWPSARAELRGLERTLVGRHLESCEECRQDLQALGFEPVLEVVPSREGRQEDRKDVPSRAPAPEPAAESPPPPARAVRLRWTPAPGWREWILGGWAAVATAAVLVLLLVPAGRERPGAGRSSAVLPWVTTALVRGAGAPALTVPPDTRALVLAVPVPADIPVDRDVALEAFAPDGRILMRSVVPAVELARGRVLALLETREPLAAGTYRVRLGASGGAPGAAAAETFFELRVEGP